MDCAGHQSVSQGASQAGPLTVNDLEKRIDQLTQALLHLTAELWVTRDRQAVLERLLIEAGIDAAAGIDRHQPDLDFATKLAAEREALIAGMLGYLSPQV